MQRREDNVAARLNGNALQPLSDVAITVTDDKTGLPATLYADNGVTPLAQPIMTDNNGYYGYYAANGEYTETFASPRIASFTRKLVLADPDDNPHATKAELAAGSGSSLVTFTQAGTGAVSRAVQDKLREAVSVKDFGAKGDGTTDDTAAFLAAVLAAKSVRVPPGTYKVSGSIDLIGSAFDGTVLEGAGRGATTINYTGSDYLFRFNPGDTSIGTVRRVRVAGMTINGTSSGKGAFRIGSSSEHVLEHLYITGFTNPAAVIIDSNSVIDYAWGQRWRNVTIKYNAGAAIATRLNKFTDTIFDGVYLSNNGNIGLQIGSGNGLRMIGGAVESHTYGIVVSTGINSASGEPPTSSVLLLGVHYENNKYHLDINNAYAVGSERVYNLACDSLIIGGAVAPANDVPITVGFATDTVVRDSFINSPNANGLPNIDIKSSAVGTRVKSTRYTASRPDVNDAGTGSQIDRVKLSRTPAWTTTGGTQPALGNGALSGDLTQDGAIARENFTWIAGSTTTFGTGEFRFRLAFKVNTTNRTVGTAVITQASTGKSWHCSVSVDSGSNLLQIKGANGGFPADYQNPFTFAANDRIDVSVSYTPLSV